MGRTEIIEKFWQLINKAKLVICLDGNLADWALEPFAKLSNKPILKVQNSFKPENQAIKDAKVHNVGEGCPDLLLGYQGKNYLVEIKDGSQPPSTKKLTPDQERFIANWKGDVKVITSVDEALDLFQESSCTV